MTNCGRFPINPSPPHRVGQRVHSPVDRVDAALGHKILERFADRAFDFNLGFDDFTGDDLDAGHLIGVDLDRRWAVDGG